MDNITPSNPRRRLVKEGWLEKRAEHMKTWRKRYFVLFENGDFLGFKDKPESVSEKLSEPLNNFTVQNCQVLKTDRPKEHTFLLRGLQWTSVIERTFCAESRLEREQWCVAIEHVAFLLSEEANQNDQMFVEMSNGAVFGQQDMSSRLHISTTERGGRGKRISLDDFEFIKVLGKGTFGKVILSREKATGQICALKILKKEAIIEKDEVNHTLTEKRVLQQTNHPFLISLKYSFTTADRLIFVLEYVKGGELFFHLGRERIFSEDRTRFYGAQILLGLEYLHHQGIIYRDLKLENLLLDMDGNCKIADFGLCKEGINYGDRTDTFCGTPEYLSYEMLVQDSYGRAVDFWSLGIVMYEMMVGRLPFCSQDHEVLFESILQREVRFPRTLSTEAKSLLSGLLAKDESKRLGGGPDGANEVKQHPFFMNVNWTDVYEKKIEPPFKPQLNSDTDTQNFDQVFTGESVQLTPPPATNGNLYNEEIGQHKASPFNEFSYHGSGTLTSSSHTLNSMIDQVM